MSNGSINKGSLIKGAKKVADKPIKQVSLLSVTTAPSGTFQAGSKYYNSTDKLIYTSVTDNSWTDAITEKPEFGTVYIYDNSGTIQYYQWNGVNLVQTDVNNIVFITGTQTITGNKTFSGSVALGDNATAQTKPISDTSDAPATTKFVKDYVQDGEWQKPADWIDIRSGALDNSVYFLVAHSKPTGTPGSYVIADYPNFAIMAGVSTSENTYDVFVDGIKVATTAHNTATEIDWATLYNNGTLIGGYDVMHPSELTTHVVRVTPSVATDNLILIRCARYAGASSTPDYGVLWCHFEIEHAINIRGLLGGAVNNAVENKLCEALTAENDKIIIDVENSSSGLNYSFRFASSLVKLPILEASSSQYAITFSDSFNNVRVKKIIIKNNSESTNIIFLRQLSYTQILEIEHPVRYATPESGQGVPQNVYALEELPDMSTKEKGTYLIIPGLRSIKPFILDLRFNNSFKVVRIYGDSTHIIQLKGLVVSSEAPFNGSASQITVSYTAMDRAALVRLFKSLPVGYIKHGTITITDGVMSGFNNSNYLTIPTDFSNNNFEILLKLEDIGSASFARTLIKFSSDFSNYISITNVGHLQWNGVPGLAFNSGFNTSGVLYIKAIKNGLNYSFGYSNDGTNYTMLNATLTEQISYTSQITLLQSGNWGGIDVKLHIKDCYIKTNDLYYLKGYDVARIISVVGCTGTPDLTAEDKAIAEDKGWSIVLS